MMANTNLIVVASISERGVMIAIAGMLIVSFALTFISLFIAAMPHVLAVVAKYWPEVDEPHARRNHPESLVADDEVVIAAIGFVLHHEFQKQLLAEQAAVEKKC